MSSFYACVCVFLIIFLTFLKLNLQVEVHATACMCLMYSSKCCVNLFHHLILNHISAYSAIRLCLVIISAAFLILAVTFPLTFLLLLLVYLIGGVTLGFLEQRIRLLLQLKEVDIIEFTLLSALTTILMLSEVVLYLQVPLKAILVIVSMCCLALFLYISHHSVFPQMHCEELCHAKHSVVCENITIALLLFVSYTWQWSICILCLRYLLFQKYQSLFSVDLNSKQLVLYGILFPFFVFYFTPFLITAILFVFYFTPGISFFLRRVSKIFPLFSISGKNGKLESTETRSGSG